jgi:hypothetical protein
MRRGGVVRMDRIPVSDGVVCIPTVGVDCVVAGLRRHGHRDRRLAVTGLAVVVVRAPEAAEAAMVDTGYTSSRNGNTSAGCCP